MQVRWSLIFIKMKPDEIIPSDEFIHYIMGLIGLWLVLGGLFFSLSIGKSVFRGIFFGTALF